MQFTPKKLKVMANITMAYIINYLNKYCSLALEEAFSAFIKSQTYRALMNLKSELCLEMAPDVLFMYADESGTDIDADNFDSFNDAYTISDRLQYTVNMSEAFREKHKINTSQYPSFIKKHKAWEYIYTNYEDLCGFPKEKFFSELNTAMKLQ